MNDQIISIQIFRERVKDAGVPIVNYGIFIAATQGILKRTLEPFEEASRILNEI
jgi:hypothetical protein